MRSVPGTDSERDAVAKGASELKGHDRLTATVMRVASVEPDGVVAQLTLAAEIDGLIDDRAPAGSGNARYSSRIHPRQ